NRKDLLAVFSNGLVYSLNKDGARAWYNGNEIEVQKTYFVQTPEGLLKVSFNAETGEFWYVFEL
ncbi:MAG: hypothetical protein NWQ19_07120, partial [Nonlabens sp.]|nr:hypothetical protein [Nonlabens sp.]